MGWAIGLTYKGTSDPESSPSDMIFSECVAECVKQKVLYRTFLSGGPPLPPMNLCGTKDLVEHLVHFSSGHVLNGWTEG
jgi:hypothetical protein